MMLDILALGRGEERLRARRRSRSSSPPARAGAPRAWRSSASRARTSREARAARAGVPAPEPPGRLPDLRSGRRVQAAGLLARAPGARRSACATSRSTSRRRVVFGPTIVYDAERCIMCTRCIRFWTRSRRIRVLDMRERGNLNEISSRPGRQLDHDYTLMTEHVCPVGALTTQRLPLQGARLVPAHARSSVCQGCATGCNAYLDYDPRDNKAYRYRPRDNKAVNKYWMCDEGMLSYTRAHEGRVTRARASAARRRRSTQALAEAKKRFARRRRRSRIARRALARSTRNEDNLALRELGARSSARTSFYVAGAGTGYERRHPHRARTRTRTRAGVAAARAATRKPLQRSCSTTSRRAQSRTSSRSAASRRGRRRRRDGARASSRRSSTIAAHDGPLTEAAHVVAAGARRGPSTTART